MAKQLALHETLEIHEIMTMKQSCLVKSYALSPLVKDKKLKKLIEQDIKESERALKELQPLFH
ncbi:spore coat protein [Exiguobacterium sp. s138]|uniref:spore coat protein n=1 Tax=Exiguobacterium sp. s138 TaxID=2751202 RepID=UPI001BE9BABD|nr:spore coat protein [Exiguobacterium sp. s138]